MNLAYRFPIIYWNCANLIVNSATLEGEEGTTNYAKLADAVNKIKKEGIEVSLVNINTSGSSFVPDERNNRILYGTKAISGLNEEIMEKIKAGRPYKGIKDFLMRCPLNKIPMINLIKAGAFDEVDKDFRDRFEIMAYYLYIACQPKMKLNMQNFNGLVKYNLIPAEFELQKRLYFFTKYLRANKYSDYYIVDNTALEFLEKYVPSALDDLIINGKTLILKKVWDKTYNSFMAIVKEYIKENEAELLKKYNFILFKDEWMKYCGNANLSAFEMDSLCFYYHEHELANVNFNHYGISDFNKLQSEEVDYYYKRGGKQLPIYRLYRIAGTCIAKDDNRTSITLLTTTGLVTVKFSRDQYSKFKAVISEIGEDGVKHRLEKSWFTRGTLLVVTGFRRGDSFVAKTYAKTPVHTLYKITEVDGNEMKLTHERVTGKNTVEEEEYE